MGEAERIAAGLPGGAPDQEVQDIMNRLSDMQTWCFLMTRKDSGGMEAGRLVQDVRCLIVERLYHKHRILQASEEPK